MGGCEGVAWVNTKYADPNDDWPDIEFHFLSGTPASDDGIVGEIQFYFQLAENTDLVAFVHYSDRLFATIRD